MFPRIHTFCILTFANSLGINARLSGGRFATTGSDCASSGGDQVKNFNSSISTSMERAAIRVAPSGRAATKVFAALLVFELISGTIGCSKSKPVAQNSQESNQVAASQPATAVPNVVPVTANQPETPKKKSVKGPVRKARTLLYTDPDTGFSFAYPRKSALKVGQSAELEAIGMDWLPLNFVQTGGTTVTMLELPSNAKEQDRSGEFFAVSVHNGLTAEQCAGFAGQSAPKSDDNSNTQITEKTEAMPISKVSVRGVEYSELDRQTEQGTAKYYHRFVPASAEISSCYEFTLALRAPEKKIGDDSIASGSQVEKKDDFARLERVLASVKIKADSEPVKVAKEEPSTAKNNNEVTEAAKTVASGDRSPR